MITKKHRIALCAGMLAFLGTGVSARADYIFNFNSLSAFSGASGNNSTAIAQYMDLVIGGACAINLNCVTVTGAVTNQTYNGENHVVGPGGNSLTLGNSEGATSNSSTSPGATDTFISTIVDGSSRQVSTAIKIVFSHGIILNGAFDFDFEIFPDATCPDSTHCSAGAPDFKFGVNGGPTTQILGVFPGNPGTNGNSTGSPDPNTTTEKAAQYIGHWSTTLTNVTELDFVDWPAAIAVDNLRVATPEPRGYAMLLGGLMLALFVGTKLRQGFAKS
jgi:hypothetical protein